MSFKSKFIDKVKDIFTEPNIDDDEPIKIEKIEKEPLKIEKEIEKEEKKVEIIERIEKIEKEEEVEETQKAEEKDEPEEAEEVIENREVKEERTRERTKTPVFFTDKDFDDLEPERVRRVEREVVERKREPEKKAYSPKKEEKKLYNGSYSGTYTSTSLLTTEKPTFKPTPIISPIYGILDKNYTKDDIVEKKESSNSVKKASPDKFEQIRSKAYGTLEDELEETIYEKTTRERSNEEDMFDEIEREQTKKVNLEDTAELAKTVTEQEKNIRELEEITMDLTKELDNLLLKKESFNSKKAKVEKTRKTEEDDSPLTEDELFNLIDSMYEEGKE